MLLTCICRSLSQHPDVFKIFCANFVEILNYTNDEPPVNYHQKF